MVDRSAPVRYLQSDSADCVHQGRVCPHRVRRNDPGIRRLLSRKRLTSSFVSDWGSAGGGHSPWFLPTAYFTENPWKWGLGVGVLSILVIHYSFPRRKSLVWILVELSAFRGIAVLRRPESCGPAAVGRHALCEISLRRGEGLEGLWRPVGPALAAAAGACGGDRPQCRRDGRVLIGLRPLQEHAYRSIEVRGPVSGQIRDPPWRSTRGPGIRAGFPDSPWLGHGSGRSTRANTRRSSPSFARSWYAQSVSSSPLIPTHSYLMGALVWSGVIGGLFWVVVLSMVFKQFIVGGGPIAAVLLCRHDWLRMGRALLSFRRQRQMEYSCLPGGVSCLHPHVVRESGDQ